MAPWVEWEGSALLGAGGERSRGRRCHIPFYVVEGEQILATVAEEALGLAAGEGFLEYGRMGGSSFLFEIVVPLAAADYLFGDMKSHSIPRGGWKLFQISLDRRSRHGPDDGKAVAAEVRRHIVGVWGGRVGNPDTTLVGVPIGVLAKVHGAGHMDDDAGAVPSRCPTPWWLGRGGSTPGVGGTAAGLGGRIVTMRHGNRKRVALTRGPGRAEDPENNTNCAEEGKRTAMESILVHRLGFLRYGRMT